MIMSHMQIRSTFIQIPGIVDVRGACRWKYNTFAYLNNIWALKAYFTFKMNTFYCFLCD